MSKALTYVEIDVDRCANTFGTAPCAASILAGNDTAQYYNFDTNATLGWVVGGGLASIAASASGLVYTEHAAGAADQYMTGPTGMAIDGGTYPILVVDIEQVSAGTGGAWRGHFRMITAGAVSYGGDGVLPAMVGTGRQLLVADLSLISGFSSVTIDQVAGCAFRTGASDGYVFKVHSIRFCKRGAGFKCFNSLKTCADRLHLTPQTETLRFCIPSQHNPTNIDAVPNIVDLSFTPATISLGEDLGQRATMAVSFMDHPHSDTGPGGDRYLSSRSYNPWAQGTFWSKFRARFPYLQGRTMRVYRGTLGQQLSEMDVRYYVIDSMNGPTPKGIFTINAKDVLKLADDDKSQAPAISQGFLLSDMLNTDTSFVASPTGVGVLYPTEGYLNLGGSEVVKFGKVPAITSNTLLPVLCLHAGGADASVVFTDSSAGGRTPTVGGNAQIDTAQAKIGSASMLFDGTGDFLHYGGSADFAFGSNDFSVLFWYKPNSDGVLHDLYDSRPPATEGAYLTIYRQNDNKLNVYNNGNNRIISTTLITVAKSWTHVAVIRKNGVTRLYIDGIQEGGDYIDATVYLNAPSVGPMIGASGSTSGTTNGLNGWLDEFLIYNGLAVYSDTFVPQTAASSSSIDTFSIARAQYNTAAVTHSNQDRVQLCLQYLSDDPASIIYDLLTNYAGIDPSFINFSSWTAEVGNYLQRNYSALIPNPTGVNKLVSELIEQAALALWWDDSTQKIILRVLRSIPIDATLLNEDNVSLSSMTIDEQPDKRLSQIWTYYALINPLIDLSQTNNYRSVELDIAAQLEADYGLPSVKQIFSRWIPQFGRSIATRLNQLVLGRYQNPPRKFSFASFGPISSFLGLGDGYNVEWRTLTDEQGAAVTVPVQVTRLDPSIDNYKVEAEEALFAPIDQADLNNRQIIIDTNTTDFNLRTIHDSLFPVITDPTGITVTAVIQAGVIVGSTQSSPTTRSIAFNVGDWPVGTSIVIEMDGSASIRGGGGRGGSHNDGVDGFIGGTGLYTRFPVVVNAPVGSTTKINGGGGGGGYEFNNDDNVFNSGSGGAGYPVGQPGPCTQPSHIGNVATIDAGGAANGLYKESTANSGKGGDPGQAGTAGSSYAHGGSHVQGHAAGAAGTAIDGVSHVTYSHLTPTINGAQIN